MIVKHILANEIEFGSVQSTHTSKIEALIIDGISTEAIQSKRNYQMKRFDSRKKEKYFQKFRPLEKKKKEKFNEFRFSKIKIEKPCVYEDDGTGIE